MKQLFTMFSLILAIQLANAQTVVSYDYTVSGACLPATVTVNFSTNNPLVTYYEVTAMFGGGTVSFINDPYITSTSSSSLSLNVNFYTGDFDLVATENISINISGASNTYTLTSTLSEPYAVSVMQDVPLELVTNDNTITSVAWDFGDGSVVSGSNAITYQYQQTGDYIITCTIESATCGTVIRQKSIQVSNLQLDYPANICVGSEVTMTISGFNPNVAQFEVIFQTHSINVDANQPTFTEEFWYSGLTTISVYGYDATQNFVEFKTFELDVNGDYYMVSPYWFMYALGQTANLSLVTESGNPLDITDVNWSNGMSGTSISFVTDTPSFQNVTAEFINPCNNQNESADAYVYVIEGQVNVNTKACAPALINVSYTGDTIYGIMGIQLFDLAENLIQSWPFAHEFDYQFDFGGQYIVRVSYALGDALGQINYPIIINGPTTTSINKVACGSYQFGPDLLTVAGTYTMIIPSAAGCDSTINLTLTFLDDYEVEIEESNGALHASAGDVFQWFNCTTGEIIPGATSNQFIPTVDGLYGVVATLGTCTDSTEICVQFEIPGANIFEQTVQGLVLYPNPITLNASNSELNLLHVRANTEIMMFDQLGKVLHSEISSSSETKISVSNLESGVYFVRATNQNGTVETLRVVIAK